ncbi:MAG: radical SAM protein [Archaeoglobaceae archaeon]
MKIVLTAERCLMSNYNGALFLGFMGCAPKNLVPSPLFFRFVCPPVAMDKNGAVLAPNGTRKIEAALIENGFEVIVVPPEKIEKFARKAKAIGITTNDPLGLGPASSTFSGRYGLVKEESYNAFCFKRLVQKVNEVSDAKIVVGGAGAWQLADEKIMKELGIDVVVIGEGEKIAPEIFGKILNGEDVHGIFYGDVVEQIPVNRRATVGGIVEIARGCGRGCKFCQPTLQRLRSRPLADIIEEVKVNAKLNKFATLHAEDVLRYKANGFEVNKGEVLKLFSETSKICKIGISHFSLATVAKAESIVSEISSILGIPNKNQPWLAGQTGIETGSPKLIKEHMPGKVLPFKAEEWCDVVETSFGICADNHWIPCATLIIGLPNETEEDVLRTIELLGRLKNYKSLIVPLFFVPVGTMKATKHFSSEDLKHYHWELMITCWKHDTKWMRVLANEYLAKMPMVSRFFLQRFIDWAIREGERRLEKMLSAKLH